MDYCFKLYVNKKNRRSGQALILSIAVMFLLAFLGAIFVTMVGQNLGRAERAGDVLAAQYLAEAGIRYADRQLTYGEDGADWRPAPPEGDPDPRDPDYRWISGPIEQRFSRYNYGDGRFLIRVSYNPRPDDKWSKCIKIESIGRIGNLNELYVCPRGDHKSPNPGNCPKHNISLVADPTMFSLVKSSLRRELVAYKPIGVTDYLRFVTNREKRQITFALGAPDGQTVVYEGPIRVNGNLLWYGKNAKNEIRLRGTIVNPPAGSNENQPPLPIDCVEVAGKIFHEDDSTQVIVKTIVGNAEKQFIMRPSDDQDFTTAEGFYRDGNDRPDNRGFSRHIVRLEPPIIDLEDPATGINRYRQLTLNSGRWHNVDNEWVNAGRFGWGAGIYINNNYDVQRESESLLGGFSLRSDWVKPNNSMTAYWRGPYYVPPGVQIILHPNDINGDGKPDITLIRTDTSRGGSKRVWRSETGEPLYGVGQRIVRPYPENGVIFAEGNIRIKGMLPDPDGNNGAWAKYAQLTVVSNASIYIEGNILKYRAPGELEGDPRCVIALLARDYVCLNTTQFVSLLTDTGPAAIGSDSRDNRPPFHLIISPDPTTNFRTEFAFGPGQYLLDPDFKPMLFVRHAAQEGTANINMWINPGQNSGLYDFASQTAYSGAGFWPNPFGIPSYVYGLNDPRMGGTAGVGSGTSFEQRSWMLPRSMGGFQNGRLDLNVGRMNFIEVGLDQVNLVQHNYLLSGFTIQPMDIRIEAIIMAQNKSFFIIPGPWFNPDPRDSRANFEATGKRWPGTSEDFPFYGEPLDIKITFAGCITENRLASRSDVEAWMAKWGKIPEKYGASSKSTYHPGEGLTYIYDPYMSNPRLPSGQYIRMDRYGRPLPPAPKLPVCTSLVYFGEPS